MNDFEFFFEQSALEIPIPGIQIRVHYSLHIPPPLSGPLYSITHSTTTLKKLKDYNNNTFQCWTTQSCDLAKIPVGAALMIMMRRRRES